MRRTLKPVAATTLRSSACGTSSALRGSVGNATAIASPCTISWALPNVYSTCVAFPRAGFDDAAAVARAGGRVDLDRHVPVPYGP
jgi:hypothetical protein